MEETLREITQETAHLCQMADSLNADHQNNMHVIENMSQSLDQLIEKTRTFKNDIELQNDANGQNNPTTFRQRFYSMFRRTINYLNNNNY